MEPNHKAVIVTGAASGIGLAMTMGLVTDGHHVTAVDRNAAALAALSNQPKKRSCPRGLAVLRRRLNHLV